MSLKYSILHLLVQLHRGLSHCYTLWRHLAEKRVYYVQPILSSLQPSLLQNRLIQIEIASRFQKIPPNKPPRAPGMTKEITTEMLSVVEFIIIRQRIELLTKQIVYTTAHKAVAESSIRLDEASKLLVKLTAMASSDMQDIAIERLTRQLAGLGITVGALAGKKRLAKKQPVV